MKKKIIGFLICLILISLNLSTLLIASENCEHHTDQLQVGVFGASLLTGLRRVGFVLVHDGEQTIHDITWSFTVNGISDERINIEYNDQIETFEPNESVIFSTNELVGRGFIEVSATASSSQGDFDTERINMFQLGPFTMGSPMILAWS